MNYETDVEKINDQQFHKYFSNIPLPFAVIRVDIDSNGKPIDFIFDFVNDAFAELENLSVSYILGKSFFFTFPKKSKKWLTYYWEAAYQGIRREWNEYNPVTGKFITVSCYQHAHGQCACFMRDVTKDFDTVNELNYRDKFDSLTNIYNKQTFCSCTSELLIKNADIRYAIGCIDIEKFKIINDLYGMAEGDKLLQFIASKLRNYMCRQGIFGRFDADIFTICFVWSNEAMLDFVNFMQNALLEYPAEFKVNLCFGFYVVEVQDTPVEIMCDRAKLAMQTVKGSFVRRYAVYAYELRNKLIEEQELMDDMERAMANGEFQVYLQPKCAIDTKKIIGSEALVRWFHPTKGMIPPNKFIPVFEKNGSIVALDFYVWECVCKLLRRWLDEGFKVLPVSVNVSQVHGHSSDFYEKLVGLSQKYQIDPRLLELELTESAYIHNQQILFASIENLRAYGFKFLMDDFGSGYSSLNALKDIPVDQVKIDLQFLTGLKETNKAGQILTSVIRMTKLLSLPVIVEGVETKEQAVFLNSISCNMAQGYYFYRPMPIIEYEKLVEEELPIEQEQESSIVVPDDICTEDFLNPNSSMNALFNSLIGAVGIYELHKGNVEIVRANYEYFKLMQWGREEFYLYSNKVVEFVSDEDKTQFLQIFSDSINSVEIRESVFKRRFSDGYVPIHIKVRFITGSDDRFLFYATLQREDA